MIPKEQKYNYTMMQCGETFYSSNTSTKHLLMKLSLSSVYYQKRFIKMTQFLFIVCYICFPLDKGKGNYVNTVLDVFAFVSFCFMVLQLDWTQLFAALQQFNVHTVNSAYLELTIKRVYYNRIFLYKNSKIVPCSQQGN